MAEETANQEVSESQLENLLFGEQSGTLDFGEPQQNNPDQEKSVEGSQETEKPPDDKEANKSLEQDSKDYVFKVNGDDIKKSLTDEDLVNLAQKGVAWDQNMSKLDLEKKTFQNERDLWGNEKTKLETFAKDGEFVRDLREKAPDLYVDIMNRIQDYREGKTNKKNPMDDMVSKFKEESKKEMYKDVPLVSDMANALEVMSGRLGEIESASSSNSYQVKSDLDEIKTYNKQQQEALVKQEQAKQIDRLRKWGDENKIDLKKESTENPRNIQRIQTLWLGGDDIISAAKLVYNVSEKLPDNNSNSKGNVEIREKQTGKIRVTKDNSSLALSEEQEDFAKKMFGNVTKPMFG